MFQHIVSTPKNVREAKAAKQEEPEEIEVLSLAPFTPNPKLAFNDIKIGVSVTRKICIKNPTGHNIMLYLQKLPPEERNVKFSWTEQMVYAATEEMFEITWMPLSGGAWRDTIQLTDNGRVRRDIPIAFKSIKPETKKKKIGVNVKKASLQKSPKKKFSTGPPTARAALTVKNIPQIVQPASRRSTYNIPNTQSKENFLPSSMQEKIKVEKETFDDSLENIPTLNPRISWPEPYTPDRIQTSFCCSTGVRSAGITPTLDMSMEAYSKGNISGSTYVKDAPHNTSSETYVKANTSGETYIKANTSGGTYVKDGSIANLADLQLSPMEDIKLSPRFMRLSPCIESPHLQYRLGAILEESSIDLTPLKKKSPVTPTGGKTRRVSLTPTKRSSLSPIRRVSMPQITMNKINVTYELKVSPVKKASPVKRLAKGYSMKPMHLKQFAAKPTSPAVINAIAAEVTTTKKEMCFNSVCNPYVLAQTSGVDPFVALTMYYDPQWVDEQISRFKNWLNALLTPPKDLSCTNVKVDIAKMWQDSRNKEVEKAPTKEQVSSSYNTNHLLQSLRHLASKLYRSTEIMIILSKTCGLVENNKFVIRVDKDLHQDVRIQKEILQLFFCYNPLWLRIGLEQVYNRHIQLRSNSDCLGLSKFLMLNFFQNAYLLKKYKHKTSPKYALEMKKESLKKFLSLIYFLDQAKLQKLIPYDPCLFTRNAPIKESKEILLRFASELFFASGDVTKPLRHLNYVLQYKQTYIHEFEYGIDNLGSDLKDGVRLTRVMEIILLERNLTDVLRVPAISRLQKIHNVKLAFDALKRSGYTIESNIEPKDIVEGHREKTLSFLWQIIYKFQSPRYTKAVISVQVWWRSERIQEKLRALRAQRLVKENAAIVIQRWYRRHKLRQRLIDIIPFVRRVLVDIQLNKAACKIQAEYRGYKCRRDYLRLYQSTLVIQRQFRRWYLFSHLRKKRTAAALVIQNVWKAYSARKRFLMLKQSVAVISAHYIALKQMRQARKAFLGIRSACVIIQKRYRATVLMRRQKTEYLRLHSAVCVVQIKWRATLLMNHARFTYLQLQNACILVQRRFRAQQSMKQERESYRKLRDALVVVQRRFRANKSMKIHRTEYLTLKQAVISVQRRFRANLLAGKQREDFLRLKKAVKVIESRYQAKKLMEQCKMNYCKQINASIVIQTRFRALLDGRRCRQRYLQVKRAVKVFESRWEALKLMRLHREAFERKVRAVLSIQRRFRAQKQMIRDLENYVKLRGAVVKIQTYYRATVSMKRQRNKYLLLKKSTLLIQRKWLATIDMKLDRARFKIAQRAIIKIQRWYRDTMTMRLVRDDYRLLRKSVICVQKRFRANLLMEQRRGDYLTLKKNVIAVQRRFRANRLMKTQRTAFMTLKQAVINLQRRFRANLSMKLERGEYLKQRRAAVSIQAFVRGYFEMKRQKNVKRMKLRAVFLLQVFGRGCLARRMFEEMNDPEVKERRRVERLRKTCAIKIQAVWRAFLVRSRQSKEMALMRLSLEAANRRARPEDTIWNKTKKNINILANDNVTIIQMQAALKELEVSTRFCQHSCVSLARRGVCDELYAMILGSCGSRGDMEAAAVNTGILINIAKYTETKKYAWMPSHMPNIVKIMVRCCDKEFNFFAKLATLLWIFGHNPEYRGVVCDMPNFAQQMMRMMALCERQQKMVSKSYKGKNASVFATYANLESPTVKPDWGLDYKHAPHIFTNSVHAIRSLCKLFNV